MQPQHKITLFSLPYYSIIIDIKWQWHKLKFLFVAWLTMCSKKEMDENETEIWKKYYGY